MTVQEIQEIGFEKAVFGGYDMIGRYLSRARRRGVRCHAEGKCFSESEDEGAGR